MTVPPMPVTHVADHLRCHITYRWGLGSGGSENFGVTGEDDPKIEAAIEKLKSRGKEIVKVYVY